MACCPPVITTTECTSCEDCSVECPNGTTNTSCAVYNGEDLDNLDITSGDPLNDILVAINDQFGSGDITETLITLSSADIKLLFTSGFTLIIAPGSNKFIDVLRISVRMATGTVGYTVAGQNLQIKTLNATNPMFILPDTALSTTNVNIVSKPISYTTGYDVVRVNDPLIILHPTANPTGGDGTVSIYISYIIKNV